jgi:chemotaxis protein CheC
MKTLSDFHVDALSEIINIATERAVQGLSSVIGEAVQSSSPLVDLLNAADANVDLLRLKDDTFGVVTQEITGVINAEVMLLFTQENVLRIVRNMMGTELDISVVREFENEVMCELGNIMMNAYVSSIADMLHVPIASGLPHYTIKSSDEVAQYIKKEKSPNFVLASHVDLAIEQQPTEGKMFFLMNSITLGNIVSEIDKLAE